MTYYISTTGSDLNPGTIGSPFLTFAKAESVVVAGDLVLIDDGTYAGITTSVNGTNNSTRITFQAINEGSVVLSSPIVSSNYFRTYDGFTFNNTSDRAFDILGGNNNFLNITININYGVGYGIKIGMDANVGGSLASNNVINNLRIVSTFVGAQTVHGVLFGGGASGNAIFNSYISNTYYGIVDKVCNGSRVYNCVFNFTASGLYNCIYSKGSTNGLYVHNVLRTTGNCFGVIMAPSDGGSPQSTGSQILNNIFIKGTNAAIYNAGTGSFISDYNVFQYSGGSLVLDPASFLNLAAWQGTGHDLHSIAATPLFTNVSTTLTQLTDYKPTNGSPVINVGTTSFRTLDAGGNSVVSVPDIGPWEFQAVGNTYWISTTGNDANSGTSIGSPWEHIEKINGILLQPGDVVNIRAGVYDSYAPLFASAFYSVQVNNKNGTPSAHITIQGYPPDFVGGGAVVYNLLNITRTTGGIGISTLNSSYIDFFRISVVGPSQEVGTGTGTYAAAWWLSATIPKSNITVNICEALLSMTGFRLDNVNNVTFNNCDAHDLDDPFTGPPTGPHNNSDGFSRTGHGNTATNTVYNYCRAWNCSDDGWDCFRTVGSITYNGCWSFHNGYNAANVSLGDGNGFKMGGTTITDGSESASTTIVTRFVTRCLAAGNKNNGFDQNAAVFLAQLYNNSAINNGVTDFKFAYYPERQIHHIFKNNASFGNGILAGNFLSEYQFWVQANNSWNGIVTIDAGDFASLGPLTELETARNADGTLPVVAYAHLVLGSDLIDAGVLLPIPYNGLAPDLGAFEFGDVLPIPGDPPPVTETVTGLSVAFTLCDPPPVGGYEILYRVAGDPDWISAGFFMSSPAVITGLSYPVGTVFEVKNDSCSEIDAPPPIVVCTCRFGVAGEDDTATQTREFNQQGFTFDIFGDQTAYWQFYYQDTVTGAFADFYMDTTQVFMEASNNAGQDANIYVSPTEIDFFQTDGVYNFANVDEFATDFYLTIDTNGYIHKTRIYDNCRIRTIAIPVSDDGGQVNPVGTGNTDLSTMTEFYVDTWEVYLVSGDDTAWVNDLAVPGRTITFTKVGDPTVTATMTLSIFSISAPYYGFSVTLISATPYAFVNGDQFNICWEDRLCNCRFAFPGEDDTANENRYFDLNAFDFEIESVSYTPHQTHLKLSPASQEIDLYQLYDTDIFTEMIMSSNGGIPRTEILSQNGLSTSKMRVYDGTSFDWNVFYDDGAGNILASQFSAFNYRFEFLAGGTGTFAGTVLEFRVVNLPIYADDAAATAGGLVDQCFYRTLTGEVRIKL